MSEWLTMVINDSEARGRMEGENRFTKLLKLLLTLGRTEDAAKPAGAPEYRDTLYKEFQIA